MAAERDVIIRVAIQQATAELKAPDVAPVVQAQREAKQAADRVTEAMAQERAQVEQLAGSQQVLAQAEQQATSFVDEQLAKLREESGVLAEQMRIESELGNTAVQSAEQRDVHLTRLMRPMNQVLRGTEGLIRATIELSAANEEDAEKMMRKFMRYDAYFQLASGGIRIVGGLGRAMSALAAEETAAGAAALAAFAPILPIVAAIGAAVYVADQAFDAFGRHATDAEEKWEAGQRRALDLISARKHAESELEQQRAQMRDRQDEVAVRVFRPDQDLPHAKQQQLELQNELAVAQAREKDEAAKAARFEEERLNTTQRRHREASQLAHLRGSREEIKFQNDQTGVVYGDLEKELAAVQKQIADKEELIARLKKEEADQAKNAVDAENAKFHALEKQHSVLERIGDNLRSQLRTEQEALHTVRAKEDAERARMSSSKERIGRLSDPEKDLARTLADRVSTGKASVEDKKKLEQLVGRDLYDFGVEAQREGTPLAQEIFKKTHGGHEMGERLAAIHREEAPHEQRIADLEKQIRENDAGVKEAAGKLRDAVDHWSREFRTLMEFMAQKIVEEVRKQMEAARKDKAGKLG